MDIEKLLSEMTLDEKIGQLQQVYLQESNFEQVIEMIKAGKIGSCILALDATAGNSDDHTAYAELSKKVMYASKNESRMKIPVIIGRDIIHGDKTVFPVPLAQAATWDMELIREGAQRMMAEASQDGINWTFAPMLDLAKDPRWGRIIESYGEDPYLGSAIAKASVEGSQSSGSIAACAKHFIGYGSVEGGRDYTKGEITDYTLRNMYLPAFRAAVNAGVKTVMNSFSSIGGTPCVANEYLFKDILRDELGFDGFVISDWGSIEWQLFHKTCETKAECAENSIKAGIDMEMVTTCYAENLKKLLDEGKISEELINESVRRILKVKADIGLFDEIKPLQVNDDNLEFAKEFAKNAMILLKNDNDVLPLKEEPKSILILGPMAKEKRALSGSWCMGGEFDKTPTMYEAIKAKYKDATVDAADNFYEAEFAKARKYDLVILALGEHQLATGERRAMADIRLSAGQLDLAKKVKKLAKKVVAVVFAGRPLAMEELCENTDALVYGWHSGMMSAAAFADILAGDFVPCGKSPITFLRSSMQIPMYYNSLTLPIRDMDENTYYDEPFFPGYNDELSTPLFPFGYGLSYTKFSYFEPSCDKAVLTQQDLNNGEKFKITVEVENIGEYSANEVAQLYISAHKAKRQRPIKELKGFKKTFINKGEKATLTFELGKEELGYYPEKDFVVESVKYDIFVGENCYSDNKLTIEVVD